MSCPLPRGTNLERHGRSNGLPVSLYASPNHLPDEPDLSDSTDNPDVATPFRPTFETSTSLAQVPTSNGPENVLNMSSTCSTNAFTS